MTIAATSSASAVLREHGEVEAWLADLPDRKRASILRYAQSERSPVLSYLYASLLGMRIPIDEWEAWVLLRFKKLDHRLILESEIIKLQQMLDDLRELAESGKAVRRNLSLETSQLSKELRGHIEHLSREVAVHDRRSLLLAGVEITAKALRKVFGRQASVYPAIEATVEAVFAEIEAKHQA